MNLELRLLLRSPLLIAAALAAALVTTLALLAGIAQVRHVDATMHEAVAFDARALDDARAKASDAPLDAGLFGYGTLFAVPHPVAPGAWFNLGDTLAQPAVQRLRLLGLQGQVHDGTGGNPAARAAGTFDAAFVVAVLLPLLAVAVFAPLAAEEREARRDGLLAALVASPRSFWLKRVVVRSLVVLVPVLGPILVALLAMDASLAFSLGVMGGATLYALGWIGLCATLALRLFHICYGLVKLGLLLGEQLGLLLLGPTVGLKPQGVLGRRHLVLDVLGELAVKPLVDSLSRNSFCSYGGRSGGVSQPALCPHFF